MAVLAVGATPVLVDVDLATYTMDPSALAAALSPRTAVVVPVHLYGQCADVDSIAHVVHAGAEDGTAAGVTRRPIAILEDAAQAHGATDGGRMAGSMGRIAAWSFYPTKNLGTFGDGGALSTTEPALAARCQRLRMYGQVEGYDFAEPGFNARLDELHAAILRVRLTKLAANNATRRATAARYLREIRHPAVTLPSVRDGCEPVWHQFVLRAEKRDELAKHLASRSLQTLVHYARALSQMTALKERAVVRQSPRRAEQAAAQVLSLPIYPEMEAGHADEVIAAVNDWGG
jgi:dTDP-3-amino-3,4,6-trideoxy-alpha-D-glucose transaminase